jgi:hypothetical protein
VKIAETGGICWNERQPSLGGGHESFYPLRLRGKTGGRQEDEKESEPPCAALVEWSGEAEAGAITTDSN